MDTIKILLAVTAALLCGALTWNFLDQRNAAGSPPKDELARVQQDLAALELEEKSMLAERRLRNLGVDVISSKKSEKARADEAERAARDAESKALEARNKELEDELLKEKEESLKNEEDGLLAQRDLENRDKELRRARLISDAILMGKVIEYANDPTTGSYVSFDIKMPDQVQIDTILAVRRKDGIAGSVRVTMIEAGEGIADVLPGVGPFTPEPGDELIYPPD